MEAVPGRFVLRQPRLRRLSDWTLLEGRYTLAVLFEYAGTLGLIDLDYVHPKGARDDFRGNWGGDFLDALSRYDGLRAIRLNPLGAYASA